MVSADDERGGEQFGDAEVSNPDRIRLHSRL
jgi:hypothetical protein